MPDDRLAPEHKFPASIDDTLRAYEWLLEQKIPANKIAFSGESAGGAMVVSVMVAAKSKGLIFCRLLHFAFGADRRYKRKFLRDRSKPLYSLIKINNLSLYIPTSSCSIRGGNSPCAPGCLGSDASSWRFGSGGYRWVTLPFVGALRSSAIANYRNKISCRYQ
jgi:hypothetical protein